MERMPNVELFEQILGEYEFGLGTTKEIARKAGVHRRIVREPLAGALPPGRQRTDRKSRAVGQM
jgi:hypothetical protein